MEKGQHMVKERIYDKILAAGIVVAMVFSVAQIHMVVALEEETEKDKYTAISFLPEHFPTEVVVQEDEEDVVFSMSVTVKLEEADVEIPELELIPELPEYPYGEETPCGEDADYEGYNAGDIAGDENYGNDDTSYDSSDYGDVGYDVGYDSYASDDGAEGDVSGGYAEGYGAENGADVGETVTIDDTPVPLASHMAVEALLQSAEGVVLLWYQDDVRRTDRGFVYIDIGSFYEYAYTTNMELRFDVVAPEIAGTWELRAYASEDVFRSPYTLNLFVGYIPIMPIIGQVSYVNSAEALAYAWAYSGDIKIILTDSFTMAEMLTIDAGRHVIIIADGLEERILTAANNQGHFFIRGGTLTLGVSGGAADASNDFVLQGQSSNQASGAVQMTGTSTFNMRGGTIVWQ